MKFRRLLGAFFFLAFVLVACNRGGTGPDKPVEDYLKALEKMDVEKATGAACTPYRDDIQASLETMGDLDVKIEIVDLKLEVEEKEDEAARVTVSGQKKLLLGDELQEESDLAGEFGSVEVVKQDGQWLVCDKIFLLGDPKKPVEAFFEAFEEMDAQGAAGVVCEEYRAGAQASLESLWESNVQVGLVGLELEVRGQRRNAARVVPTGGNLMLYWGRERSEETDLAAAYEAIEVVKQGGRWLVCDEAFLLGDPTKPVRDLFDAFADLDAERAANTVCKEYRDGIKSGLEFSFGFLELAGDEVEIEIVGLELEVRSKQDDEATVVATSGTLKLTMGEQVQEEEIGGTEETIQVVKEDGKWRICDPAFAEGFAP
jgi:hypothetical protein